MGKGAIIAGVLGVALAGCVQGPVTVAPQAAGDLSIPAQAQSTESRLYAQYYAQIEAQLLSQGLLRQETAPNDAPVSRAALSRNFARIALFDEYQQVNGRFIRRENASRLRRWEGEVRFAAYFGSAMPQDQVAQARGDLSALVGDLAQATRHPMRLVPEGAGNFHVLFVSRDEQAALAPLLRALVPNITPMTLREITSFPRQTFCAVYAFGQSAERPAYTAAIAIIRSEHPPLMRRSCIHEELAQGLGLPNDSPTARPSIFNDDEEFAVLTTHDRLLLRMLYDPRLFIGMTPDAAAPVIDQIATELVGGES